MQCCSSLQTLTYYCADLCSNVSSVYSLLGPESAVILCLLELASLLHHLLVLGVERLPPGLHLPQLPRQGLQLLPVVIPGKDSDLNEVSREEVIHLPGPLIISSSSQLPYSEILDRELGVEVARAEDVTSRGGGVFGGSSACV